jgi:hypothetical protein
MKAISYCVLLLALIAMMAGSYNLIQMAKFIDSPTGAFGFRPLWAEGSYFTSPLGYKYRRNCIIWFSITAILMVVFMLMLAGTPDYNL